jgi:peptidoglycan hydrolase-like protein with peptidoglycan-binding domain
VSKIHTALLILEGVSVASAELRNQQYGASTAAAVLTFKRRRQIINTTYQTEADNIVGKMTIAAMDGELLPKELAALPSGDPRRNPASA